MNVRSLILLGSIAYASSSFGQCPSCFLCLTDSEARTAAYKALDGESAVRSLRITKAMLITQGSTVEELQTAIGYKDARIDALTIAFTEQKRATELATKALKVQRGKATVKTMTYIGIGVLAGFVLAR